MIDETEPNIYPFECFGGAAVGDIFNHDLSEATCVRQEETLGSNQSCRSAKHAPEAAELERPKSGRWAHLYVATVHESHQSRGMQPGSRGVSRDAGNDAVRVESRRRLRLPRRRMDTSGQKTRAILDDSTISACRCLLWRSRPLAGHAGIELRRGQSRIQDRTSGTRRCGIPQLQSFRPGIQTVRRMPAHGLCRGSTTRARQTDDDIHAGDAGKHRACLRIRRPIASDQALSRSRRGEPRPLASYGRVSPE
jgi:hypothetical protein